MFPLVFSANVFILAEALSGRGHHYKKTDKLSASLSAEQQDEDGNPILPSEPRKRHMRKAKGKGKEVADDVIDIDEDDDKYEGTDAGSDDDEADASEHEDDDVITNEEVLYLFDAYRSVIDSFIVAC